MKKIFKFFMLLLVLSSISIFINSCNKEEVKQADSNSSTEEFDTRPPGSGGGGSGGINYCFGCGYSENPNYYCGDYQDNSGIIRWECMTYKGNGEDCSLLEINKEAANNNIPVGDHLDASEGYELRDSLLAYSAIGQKYISYSYTIGKVISENSAINASNIVSHLSFANKVRTGALMLLDSTSTTEIPFNTAFKTDALSMITYYRTLDTTTYFNNHLDSIENDLNLYTNKTVSEIQALIYP